MGLELTHVISQEKDHIELHCAICKCLTDLDSYITQCSHAICKKCCPKPNKLTSCPQCNDAVGKLKGFKESQAMAFRILSHAKVKCPVGLQRGCCSWVGSYHELEWHMASQHKSKSETNYKAKEGHKKTKSSKKDKINSMNSAISRTVNEPAYKAPNCSVLTDIHGQKPISSEMKNNLRNIIGKPVAPKRNRQGRRSTLDLGDFREEEQSNSEPRRRVTSLCDLRQIRNESSKLNPESKESQIPNISDKKPAREITKNYFSSRSLDDIKLDEDTTSENNLISNDQIEFAKRQLRSGSFESCIKMCDAVLKLDNDNAETYFVKACAESEMGCFSKSSLTLASIPKKSQTSQQLKFLIGDLMELCQTLLVIENLKHNDSYKQIIEITNRMKTGKSNKFVLLARAKSFFGLGDTEMAIREATAVLEKENRNVHALIVRAKALFLNADLKKSLEDCQTALKVDPCSHRAAAVCNRVRNVHELLTEAEQKTGKKSFKKAINLLSKAINIAGVISKSSLIFRKLYLLRSEAHFRNESYNDALEDSNLILRSNNEEDMKAWKIKIKAMKKMELSKELAKELAKVVKPGMWGSSHCLLIQAYEEARSVSKKKRRETCSSTIPLCQTDKRLSSARCA